MQTRSVILMLMLCQGIFAQSTEPATKPQQATSSEVKGSVAIKSKTDSPYEAMWLDKLNGTSKLIFNSCGANIKKEAFIEKAKCIDLLNKQQKLAIEPNGKLSAESKSACDLLAQQLDFSVFPDKAYQTMVSNGLLKLTQENTLTSESISMAKQCLHYIASLNESKKMNSFWTAYEKHRQGTATEAEQKLANEAKTFFYTSCEQEKFHEAFPSKEMDTMINGQKHILMIAWKSASFSNFTKPSDIGMNAYQSNAELFKYALFMTSQKELKEWANGLNIGNWDEKSARTRMLQVLGLPPNSSNNTFVEFWVKEEDIFRPAIDSSLQGRLILQKISVEYLKQFSGFSKGSFSDEQFLRQYPFTGLGYTFDYNPENPTHKGLPEFVLKENRTVYVRSMTPTQAYLKSIK